jgi:hypothetical protein
MSVSSFNLSQSFNYAPYLFCKKGANQRSIVSVYGPRMQATAGMKAATRLPANRIWRLAKVQGADDKLGQFLDQGI